MRERQYGDLQFDIYRDGLHSWRQRTGHQATDA
jgi:hypothetical protein